MFVMIAILAIAGIAQAQSFEAGETVAVTFAAPEGASAINGEVIVTNADLVGISETYSEKVISTNGNKFVIYGINKEVMTGEGIVVTVRAVNNSQIVVGIANVTASDPDANSIAITETYEKTLNSVLDIDGNGTLDSDDVVAVIDGIYNNNLSVTDLQKVINALLEEM